MPEYAGTKSLNRLAGARLIALGFLLVGFLVSAEAASVPFNDSAWEITAQESSLEHIHGQNALKVQGGSARLKDVSLTDGIIEFDMLFKKDRGFSGGFWRLKDTNNSEQFYLRPHQSANPDANQYQPVFNGNASWQLYNGPGYSAPVECQFDQWLHIKIVFAAG